MNKNFFSFISILFINANVSAVTIPDSIPPRFRIAVYKINGERSEGLLLNTGENSISLFPGNWKVWKSNSEVNVIDISAGNINRIELKKKNGWLKGFLIGGGIGLTPLLISSIFGRGEGGAYASLITFPLGLITGSVIGIISKKKFLIEGNQQRFQEFRNNTNR